MANGPIDDRGTLFLVGLFVAGAMERTPVNGKRW